MLGVRGVWVGLVIGEFIDITANSIMGLNVITIKL